MRRCLFVLLAAALAVVVVDVYLDARPEVDPTAQGADVSPPGSAGPRARGAVAQPAVATAPGTPQALRPEGDEVVPAVLPMGEGDVVAPGDTTRTGATINTDGDIDAEERAYFSAVAAAHEGTRPAAPWVVHWAAVSAGVPVVDTEEVAQVAASAFADPRGWSLGGAIRFERVESSDAADLVVVVAEADVIADYSDACVSEQTGVPDASCAVGDLVIINDHRWRDGALGDPIPLAEFRIEEINHETGHWLGQGHFSCLAGKAAVNQQQFRSLDGCEPNAWPLPWEQAMVASRHGLWTSPDELPPD